MRARACAVWAGALAALTGTLAALGPRPPADAAQLTAWVTAVEPDRALARLAALAAWGCVCWLAVVLVVAALTAVPGTTGQVARRATRRVAPAALRGALGLGIATLPVAALPTAASADSRPPPPTWAPPSLDRPAGVVESHHGSATYVVRRGDCLWSIARDHLGTRASDHAVASTWPRWYAANKHVIGADPGLIRPGQRLAVPDRPRDEVS
jgi:nucleoid-associated protein YgaU